MIHVIYQNQTKSGVGKCSDVDLDRIGDKLYFCYNIKKTDIETFKKNDKVIFIYNEDAMFTERNFKEDMTKLLDIETAIKNSSDQIQIYNSPSKCRNYSCKAYFYSLLENEPFVPKFKIINNESDLELVNFYPHILTLTIRCLGNCRFLCNNKEETIKAYQKLKDESRSTKYEEICAIDFINSYEKAYKCYLNVRFMVINDKVIEYYARPAKIWNVHNDDQVRNLNLHKRVNEDLDKWVEANSDEHGQLNYMLTKCYKILGKGFYAYDCIIQNIDDIPNSKLYVCETGIKIFNSTTKDFYKKLGFGFNKLIMRQRTYAKKIVNTLKQ